MSSYERKIARAADALEKGRLDDAERLLSSVLGNHPKNADAHNLRALTLLQRRDMARALDQAGNKLPFWMIRTSPFCSRTNRRSMSPGGLMP